MPTDLTRRRERARQQAGMMRRLAALLATAEKYLAKRPSRLGRRAVAVLRKIIKESSCQPT